jgi:hypothetical protein
MSNLTDFHWPSHAERYNLGPCPIMDKDVIIQRETQPDGSYAWVVLLSATDFILHNTGKWHWQHANHRCTPCFRRRTRYLTKEDALWYYQGFVSKGKKQHLVVG